jgi:trimeric autotransporter adhesin
MTWNQGSLGHYNTAIGSYALYNTTNSEYNTAVGYRAGIWYDLGYNNTILGANCGGSFPGQYNIIAIGQGVTCPDNSTARIGNSATWSIGGYAGWSNFSDGRFKKDIKEDVKGLDFIMKLRPVTYHLDITNLSKQLKENQGEEWNPQMKVAMAEKEKILQTGFVAQEVEQAAKEVGFDFNGVDKPKTQNGFYALRYAEFVVPLVKAVQEQQQLIKELQSKVQQLQEQADITVLIRENMMTDKVSAYPNPANSNITVTINTQTSGNGMLQIFDSAGKLVKQMNIDVHKGMNAINLSLPEIAVGYYDLKLDWGQGMHKHVSIVKQ